VFERGIVSRRLGKTTTVRFDELSQVTRAVIDVRMAPGVTGTRQTRVSVTTPDGRAIAMSHNTSLGTWDKNLDRVFQLAASAVADRMQRTLESTGSVAWVKSGNISSKIRPDGLVVGDKFFDFAKLDMEANGGTCEVQASGSIIFSANAGAANFYPGIHLIQRLRGEPAKSRLDSMLGDLWYTRSALA
jgi:hypothetical protein